MSECKCSPVEMNHGHADECLLHGPRVVPWRNAYLTGELVLIDQVRALRAELAWFKEREPLVRALVDWEEDDVKNDPGRGYMEEWPEWHKLLDWELEHRNQGQP